jgi:mono/diheme cytochrome c family protein
MNSNSRRICPAAGARGARGFHVTRLLYVGLAVFALVSFGSTDNTLRAAGRAVAAAQDAGKTTADSVYSDDQSKRGESVSDGKCSVCHGEKLTGSDLAPGLQGDSFLSSWSGRTAGDLFEKIQTTMPADAPGSLNPQQATDVVAYIFKMNKFPSGAAELAKDEAALKVIKIRK